MSFRRILSGNLNQHRPKKRLPAGDAAAEVRRAFGGLVEPVWIEEYLETRIVPLREELADLKKRLPKNDNNK